MRRVRIIHATRPLLSGATLASLLLILALWGIGREVWVAHVIQNLGTAVADGHLALYLTTAFLNTRFVVQALVVVSLGAFVYIVSDIVRLLRPQVRVA